MRTGLPVVLLCLSLLFYLGVYIASFDDTVDFDPLHPSSFLPILGRGAQAVATHMWDIGQALFDAVANPQRERVERHLPLKDVEQ